MISLEDAREIWRDAGCDKPCYINLYSGKLIHQWNCKAG